MRLSACTAPTWTRRFRPRDLARKYTTRACSPPTGCSPNSPPRPGRNTGPKTAYTPHRPVTPHSRRPGFALSRDRASKLPATLAIVLATISGAPLGPVRTISTGAASIGHDGTNRQLTPRRGSDASLAVAHPTALSSAKRGPSPGRFGGPTGAGSRLASPLCIPGTTNLRGPTSYTGMRAVPDQVAASGRRVAETAGSVSRISRCPHTEGKE